VITFFGVNLFFWVLSIWDFLNNGELLFRAVKVPRVFISPFKRLGLGMAGSVVVDGDFMDLLVYSSTGPYWNLVYGRSLQWPCSRATAVCCCSILNWFSASGSIAPWAFSGSGEEGFMCGLWTLVLILVLVVGLLEFGSSSPAAASGDVFLYPLTILSNLETFFKGLSLLSEWSLNSADFSSSSLCYTGRIGRSSTGTFVFFYSPYKSTVTWDGPAATEP